MTLIFLTSWDEHAHWSKNEGGIAIGPGVGSCGTAAFLRKAVAVEDIFSDPRDIKYWLDQNISLQHVGVNVSMADFRKGDLRERISAAFKEQSAPLNHLVLEVTESVYMDDNDGMVARAIETLRADNLLVALDDFGTGFASLTHLLNFPVDIIKIDKSFVAQMSAGRGEVVIKALLDMADGLGMRVIAEGVETTEQAMRLQQLGCIYAQGYLFGRASSRDQTAEALGRRPRKMTA